MRIWMVPAFAIACTSDEAKKTVYSCPFDDQGSVAPDDPGSLGFSGDDVLLAASAATSGNTEVSDFVAESYGVSLTHTFTLDGDVSVIDFGVPNDASCPSGLALRVPAAYALRGSIGGWTVSREDTGFALVATDAALGTLSTDRAGALSGSWAAEVDAGLETWARTDASRGHDTSTCDMSFSLSPAPSDLTAGAWSEELAQGELDVDCAASSWTLLTWNSDVVESLETE